MFSYVVADAGGEMFRPRDKNFAHDAWRFIANHLKTERWARSRYWGVKRFVSLKHNN